MARKRMVRTALMCLIVVAGCSSPITTREQGGLIGVSAARSGMRPSERWLVARSD